MGLAKRHACIEAGAQVTLVHGNISVTLNQKAQIISVISAKEMYQSVMDNIVGQDIFILGLVCH
jgi:phosphopantothenoylcysteine decarboxylase/phosphopantothenate--cysteine ligase